MTGSSNSLTQSVALDVDDLPQGVLDLDQVRRIGHHDVDVLIGAGDLVQESVGVPPFDALHGSVEFGSGELLPGGGTGVLAAGAVGRGIEREPVALALDDVGPRAHGARDQARGAGAGVNRALAG